MTVLTPISKRPALDCAALQGAVNTKQTQHQEDEAGYGQYVRHDPGRRHECRSTLKRCLV